MKRFENRKNRTGKVFLLIFIGLAAGILAGGFFAYRNYEKNFRREAERQLSAIAELKVNELVEYRKERFGDANTFFENPAFSSLVTQFFEHKNSKTSRMQLQAWLAKCQSYYSYDGVFLLDTRGHVRMSVPETKVPIASMIHKRAMQLMRSGTVTMQDFDRNEHDQKIYLTLLVPIADDTNPNRQLGILLLRIDPEVFLYPFIQTWPVPSRTSETLIVRREGNDVLFLNELRFQKNTALNLRMSISDTAVAAVKAVLGREGIVDASDYRGEPVVADVRKVPDSPWYMVCRIDKAEIYESLRSRLWMMIFLVGALLSAAGAGVGMVWRHQRNSFYRDQFKLAEIIRDSESRYRRLFEAARDGILIVDGETGKIVDVNPYLTEILGLSRETFIGKALWEIGFFKDVAANEERFLELQEKSYVRYEDLPLAGANGEVIDVEFVSNVYFVDDRRIVQCNIRNITERKRAEAALRESDVRFRETFDLSPAGIVMVGLDKRFHRCNDAFAHFLGYLPDELVGKTIDDITFAEDRPLGMADMMAMVKGEINRSNVQKRHVQKDGQLVWGEVTTSLVRDIEEQPQYFLAITQDINERKQNEAELRRLYEVSEHSRTTLLSILEDQKQAEEEIRRLNGELERRVTERTAELAEANKELEAFSYSVSHDLRAPLRSIDGFSQALLEDCHDKLDKNGKSYLLRVRNAAQRMGQLIDDVLDLSRIHRAEMSRVNVDLSSMAYEIMEELRHAQPGNHVVVSIEPGMFAVGDPQLVRLLLQNLLENAWKFTSKHEQSRIEVGSTEIDGKRVFLVKDDGAGFDMAHADMLFAPFQRLHAQTEFPGTGIGLASVQRIVRRHGGKIWAESKVEKGATFYFAL